MPLNIFAIKRDMKHYSLLLALCGVISSAAACDNHGLPIINNDGDVIGDVFVKEASNGVLIHINVQGLPPGAHGMHFHKVGDCSALKDFASASGHIMPQGKPHGFLHPEGPHAGNLPNLIVHEDGTASVELYSQLVSLYPADAEETSATPALYDADGSALIIHENPDDHVTQPIGGAGGRIACAEIKQPDIID